MAAALPTIDITPWIGQLSIAGGFVVSTLIGIFHLNRKAAKNQREIGEDKAASNVLTTALRQRDEALEAASVAWKQRTEDAVKIGILEEREKQWQREKKEAAEDFMRLESLCRRASQAIAKHDPGLARSMFPSDLMEL